MLQEAVTRNKGVERQVQEVSVPGPVGEAGNVMHCVWWHEQGLPSMHQAIGMQYP